MLFTFANARHDVLHFTTLFGRGARNGNIATSQLDSTFGNEMTVIATRVISGERSADSSPSIVVRMGAPHSDIGMFPIRGAR